MSKERKKKVTVASIAAEANVSPATVSRVINQRHDLVTESTISQVHEAMARLGYELSIPETPVLRKRPLILLNIPDGNIFYTEVIRGALSSANSHGCHLLVNQAPLDHGSIRDFLELLRRVDASGVITLNHVHADVLESIRNVVPVIQCSEYNTDIDLPFVSIQNAKAAKDATEYLIARGRNKIAFINGPTFYMYAKERRKGFLDAINNAHLTIPRNWIVDLPEINYDMAYSAACQLLNSDPIPNAFFAVSDTLAAAVLKAAIKYHYRVPQDIMVIGFDNTDYSVICTPSITTVSQPKFQEGFTACEMLLTLMNNPLAEVNSIYLETEFIVRETTS